MMTYRNGWPTVAQLTAMVTESVFGSESPYSSPQSVYEPAATSLPSVGAVFDSPTLKPAKPCTIHDRANQV